MTFTLAIVGRPNVGKSTLFNRLVGRKIAIVDDTPGVTRDRRMGQGRIADLEFTLMDTAGLEQGDVGSLPDRMRQQTERALAEADIALMLYDARAGVTPTDEHFADWLRKMGKPVIIGANKCEGNAVIDGIYEAFSLGLGEPIGLSAEHGEGLGELYKALVDGLKEVGIDPYEGEDDANDAVERTIDTGPEEGDLEYEFVDSEEIVDDKPLRLAIVGRPNAGKSTLINYLVKEVGS